MADYDRFILEHPEMNGDEIGRALGKDPANMRRAIRRLRKPRGTLRGIGVWDLHYPHHARTLWRNILAFVADFQPDVFLFGGDNMNMDAFDHWAHQKGQALKLEGVRVKSDYEGFQSHIMDPLERVLPDACRRIFKKGNHEDWVRQCIEKNPQQGEGYWEIENNLRLDDWEVYEYGQSSEVGKLHFIHGLYVVQHNAYKTATVYHRNICYGHGHTLQTHTEITPLDADAHTATQVPCACEMNPDYARNRPNAWLNGFLTFYVQPNGNFNTFPVVAFDGHFTAPTGVTY